jgi:uncharacterized protein with PQ loop repeat
MNINFYEFFLWLAQIFYFACFVPQIFTNYRLKSGRGISELMLIAYLNTYFCLTIYIFCLNLPLAYKIMVPVQGVAGLILILQRIFYDFKTEKRMLFFYSANSLVFILLIPYAFKNPMYVGHFLGWVSFVLTLCNQLPQVFKIYREKSVEGFNFLFAFFTGLAAAIETTVAVVAGLPIQTLFMAMRGVVLFLIFSWQFRIYKK